MSGKDNHKEEGLGRDFWWYRGGEFLSDLGSSAQTLAVAWWILETTGSAASMATVLVPTILSVLVFSPLLAPLGDRFSRKKIMLWANVGLILTVSTMAWLFLIGGMTMFLLIALSIASSFFGCLFEAGSAAVVSNLVKAEQLQKANQSIQTLNSVVGLLGAAFGATMVATIGIEGAVLVNLGSFFASLIGISLIQQNTKPKRENNETDETLTIKTWSEDIYLGFRALAKVRVVLALFVLILLSNALAYPVIVLIPYLVKETLGLSPYYVGILESALAIGAILGATTLSFMTKRMTNYRTFFLGITLNALMLLIPVVMQSYWALVIGLMISTAGCIWINILIQTQITVAVPDHFRSRILSSLGIVSGLAIPVGIALAGPLTDHFGAWSTFFALAALSALVVPLYALIPNIATFFNTPAEEVGEWMNKTYPDAFDGETETSEAKPAEQVS
ncbi:hypothetical protein CS022_08055 [Veronia nyctiphanis]|uniref:Major facilitator superfamily (MFS) profile domain-containing protein n=1 Tax=Veronia nyctiphanis TaxID=1278244 RepID=A0A4Q0YU72_9GAMM|nr:MFS transporter [Veronia nyctiphanis]RXJ73684.1 hypothetical protein CS022_08055 [Veronia nyctiphanis]